MAQMGRGTSYKISTAVPNSNVGLLKWYDTKPILMATNCVTSGTPIPVKRWDKKNKEYIMIDRPEVITNYNASKGGVDKQDMLISHYRTEIALKSKKWTLRLITHAFEIAVTNSWLEYRLDANNLGIPYKNQLDLLAFKEKLGEDLITVGKPCTMSPGIFPLKRGRPRSHSGSLLHLNLQPQHQRGNEF